MMNTKAMWLGLIFCCSLHAMQRPDESSLKSIELKPTVNLTDITAYLKDYPEQKKYALIIQSGGTSIEISKPYPQFSREQHESIQHLEIKGLTHRNGTIIGVMVGMINKLAMALIVAQCSIDQPDHLATYETTMQEKSLGIATAEDVKQNLVITLLSERNSKLVCSRFHLGHDNLKMVTTPYAVSEFINLMNP